jgi:hypothetical protein
MRMRVCLPSCPRLKRIAESRGSASGFPAPPWSRAHHRQSVENVLCRALSAGQFEPLGRSQFLSGARPFRSPLQTCHSRTVSSSVVSGVPGVLLCLGPAEQTPDSARARNTHYAAHGWHTGISDGFCSVHSLPDHAGEMRRLTGWTGWTRRAGRS